MKTTTRISFGNIGTLTAISLVSFLIAGCPPNPRHQYGSPDRWYALVPAIFPAGRNIPVAVLYGRYNPIEIAEEAFSAYTDGSLSISNSNIRYSAGYFELPSTSVGSHHIQLRGSSNSLRFDQDITTSDQTTRQLRGELTNPADLVWDDSTTISVTGGISVPAGMRLTIKPGTLVLIGNAMNIEVAGTIEIEGTIERPVVFLSADPDFAWGGIYLNGGRAEISHCIFTSGGGDDSRAFGHSGSQPVIGGLNSVLEADHIAMVKNKGKAFGFGNSEITLTKSLVQRCDTGGEFAGSKVTVEDCRFFDMPINDGIAVDDDNDALYMNGARNADTSYIRTSYFVSGKDDAIDHNGALLVISDCIIDGFDNEGLAGSNARYVRIENCYIFNCEQGVEAGYGAPNVEVNHCTIRKCDTGLRFGDWYNWGCSGKLTVRNTISFDNRLHNVWNYDVLTQAPVDSAISISYSLVNDSLYNAGVGCVVGIPVIDENGFLSKYPDQAAHKAGIDSLDLGRLRSWPPN